MDSLFLGVCGLFFHTMSQNPIQLGSQNSIHMFQDESWKPIFWIKRSNVTVTNHKNTAGVGLCTLVSAGFIVLVCYCIATCRPSSERSTHNYSWAVLYFNWCCFASKTSYRYIGLPPFCGVSTGDRGACPPNFRLETVMQKSLHFLTHNDEIAGFTSQIL